MSFNVPTYSPRISSAALKSAETSLMRVQSPGVVLPAKQPANGAAMPIERQANGLYLPRDPGAAAVAQIGQDMSIRLAGLEQAMAALVQQMSPVERRNLTPELLAQAALSYQNFGFRPGLDNPTAPVIDGENGSIQGPVTLKTPLAATETIDTTPVALDLEVELPDDAQTQTGGARIIAALGLALMPSGASANLPAGYDIKSLKQALIDIGLVQVLIGTTVFAQYDAKDLVDTRFVQRVLEQPIRVQRGNYQAVKFKFITVSAPPAAAAATYNLDLNFTTYWPPVR